MKTLNFDKRDKAVSKLEAKEKIELANAYKLARTRIKEEIAQLEQDGKLNKENQSALLRLKQLLKTVERNTIEITSNLLDNKTKEIYQTSLKEVSLEIGNVADIDMRFATLPTKQLEAAIKNKFDEVGFIKRNENNNKKCIELLKKEVTSGIIQGKSYADIAKNIDDRFDIGFNDAMRIAQTEAHRVKEKATIDTMTKAKDLGIKFKKKWLSARDDNVRDAHIELNGQIIDVEDEFEYEGNTADAPGNFGVAELDINCRCTLIAIIE